MTRNLEELDYSDNPYAFGGPKFNFDPQNGKPRLPKVKYSEENHSSDNRYQHRGRGGDKFYQDRRNSDFGSYRDESYIQDNTGNFNKRTRDFYQNEDSGSARFDSHQTRGGFSKERGGFGRDRAFKGANKLDTPKGKEKDNV